MTTNVPNRKTIRQALAALLETALVGSGKPAQVLYRYKKSDFRGQSPVLVVTSDGATHNKQTNVGRISSAVDLKVHTFVQYAEKPVDATNSPAAGDNKVINVGDTGGLVVTGSVAIEDASHYEIAAVTVIVPNVSFTVAHLVNAYTTPKVYWLNEEISEDQMDLLEKSVTDTLMDNKVTDLWSDLSFGAPSQMDPLSIGGVEYNHEVFTVHLQLYSE